MFASFYIYYGDKSALATHCYVITRELTRFYFEHVTDIHMPVRNPNNLRGFFLREVGYIKWRTLVRWEDRLSSERVITVYIMHKLSEILNCVHRHNKQILWRIDLLLGRDLDTEETTAVAMQWRSKHASISIESWSNHHSFSNWLHIYYTLAAHCICIILSRVPLVTWQ
jgi:hypothetical protein